MSRDRLLQLCINQKTEFSHAKALISRPKQGKDRALLPQKPLVFQERSGIVENNAIKQLWVLFLQGPISKVLTVKLIVTSTHNTRGIAHV